MKRWWISWYGNGTPFTLDSPWWISGYRGSDGVPTFCAAVVAEDEKSAKAVVAMAYDKPWDVDWRFANERDSNWSPFCERFPKTDWMTWPPVAPPSGVGRKLS